MQSCPNMRIHYTAYENLLWERMKEPRSCKLVTSKGFSFSYEIRGAELFISRKDKSITRKTVNMACAKARR